MILDCATHTVTYVNAGHNFPYLFRSQSSEIVELQASGLPLGMLDNMKYASAQVALGREDVLMLYTDGVTEAMNRTKDQYGEDRLKVTIQKALGRHPRQIKDDVLDDVKKFIGQEPPSDDLTMLVLKQV
jgi:sigma-B regulation protein RsbU (phosphoserine phosphatase)